MVVTDDTTMLRVPRLEVIMTPATNLYDRHRPHGGLERRTPPYCLPNISGGAPPSHMS